MSNRTLRIVIVFGLDDGKLNFPNLLSLLWNSKTVQIYPFRVGWREGGEYTTKLERLLVLIDELLGAGDGVAVIGISAGASLAINAYALRPQLVGVVSVCGALRLGAAIPPRFARSVATSAAFRASILSCEVSAQKLTAEQCRRVLVAMPLRDGIVPLEKMFLIGAEKLPVIGFGHVQSILTTMLCYRRPMLRFLEHLP